MTCSRFSSFLLLTSSLALVACSAEPNKIAAKDTAMPPPEKAQMAESKGLNLSSPTIPPATKVSVRDGDDLDPNPAPAVTLLPEPEMPKPQMAETISVPDIEDAPSNAKPSVDARIANLEAQLASLRADYDRIMPTFKTLSVNSQRLSSMLDDLEARGVVATEPAAGEISAANMSMTQAGQAAAVQGVRIGAHPGKSRVVIDVSSLTGYSYDIDNTEGLMTISLQGAGWNAPEQATSVPTDLISGWTHQATGDGGSVLILQLTKPVKVVGGNSLPATGSETPRIYLDIAQS